MHPMLRSCLVALCLVAFGAAAHAQTTKLTSNTTLYVRTDGNDANTCLTNSAAGACATWQGALNKVQTYDFDGYSVIVQAGGTGARSWSIAGSADLMAFDGWTGKGNLTIIGDTANPDNVSLSTNTGAVFRVRGFLPGALTIKGFKCASTTNYCIRHGGIGNTYFGNMNFAGSYILAATEAPMAYLDTMAPSSITGDGGYAFDADAGFLYIHHAITITGARTFSTFARARNRGAFLSEAGNWVLSGGASVTAKRYDVYGDSLISTNDGADANHFPGSSAGTKGGGSTYE